MKFKETVKKHFSKVVGAIAGIGVTAGTAVTAFAETNEAVSAASSVLANATSTLNITNIVAIVGAGITAVVGLFLAWWGVRKLLSMLMNAFKKGKIKM